ncbi:MAG: methyl-accepting chemotaxis protein [Proteobacteria bacterium]|nr:methyl-accepting chemotaxis protein [Pseudomonadota bacterium]
MKKFTDWSLTNKFLTVGIVILIAFGLSRFLISAYVDKQAAIDANVTKARAICLTAESVRQEMEEKWEQELFNLEQLRAFMKTGEQEKILSSIPVVSAWRAAMRKSEQGGYEFRVPKFDPRRPENMPDYGLDYAIEGPALNKIKREDLSEYYVIDEKINSIRYFLPVKLSPICMHCHGDPETSMELWGLPNGLDPTGGTMENWKVGEIHGAFQVIQSLDKADEQFRNRLIQTALVLVVAIFIAIFIFMWVSRSITKPIIDGVSFAQQMSQGDLTRTLDIKQNDEVGRLAEAMNLMVANLGKMLKDIAAGTNTLFASSTELTTISGQMSLGADQTSMKSSTVAAAAEEMSSNMSAVAAAVEETSTNVGMVTSAADAMSSTINEIAQNSEKALSITEQAVSQSKNASVKVNQLGQAASEIGEVTETITEISEKTDLLALNATIEAARAGDAGKGFAVVANEIKELARQAATATHQIKQKIQGIQDSTSSTISEIGNITEVIDNVNDIVTTIAAAVEEQSITTKEIAANILQASQGIQEVSQNVAQSSQAAGEVAEDILNVDNSSKEMSKSSSQVKASAEDLVALAEQLKDIVEKFKF